MKVRTVVALMSLCCGVSQAQWKIETRQDNWKNIPIQMFVLGGRDTDTNSLAGIGIGCYGNKLLSAVLIDDGVVYATDDVRVQGTYAAVNVQLDGKQDGIFAKDWKLVPGNTGVNIPKGMLKKMLSSKRIAFIVRDGFQAHHTLVFSNDDAPLSQIQKECSL